MFTQAIVVFDINKAMIPKQTGVIVLSPVYIVDAKQFWLSG
jgi:hypothetical protein